MKQQWRLQRLRNNDAVTATRYFCVPSWVRGTVDRQHWHKWIGVVSGYSDLFHLVSRGQTRRNLWGARGGTAGLIGLPGLFSKICGRLQNEQIPATKTDSIVPA